MEIEPWMVGVAVVWAVGTACTYIAFLVLNYRKARHIDKNLKNIWNTRVELEDINGEVIRVPVQVKKGEDAEGKPIFETKMVVAPLWYTIATIGGTMAVQHFQQWFNNQKSHLSKRLQAGALGDAMKGDGDLGALMTMLPKKAQTALAIIQAARGLQGGGGGSGGGSGGEK